MIFNEIYGNAYQVAADIIKEAIAHNLTQKSLTELIYKKAFGEDVVTIPDAIKSGKWPLIREDLSTPIRNIPTMPLTKLQKMWLKALLTDPRISLFSPLTDGLEDVEPLYEPDFFVYFDRYADGDPYENPAYREHFRLILLALKEKRKLRIRYQGKHGKHCQLLIPDKLEYSSKDDKFRLLAHSAGKQSKTEDEGLKTADKMSGGGAACLSFTINLARIRSVELGEMVTEDDELVKKIGVAQDAGTEQGFGGKCGLHEKWEELAVELTDERNALERAMLHFSDLQKETVRLDETHYRMHIKYRKEDETEILIRILSFGPMLKVVEPETFVVLIRERLEKQMQLGRQES